jgi:hypothetical protein
MRVVQLGPNPLPVVEKPAPVLVDVVAPRVCGRAESERLPAVREGMRRGVVVPEMSEEEVVCLLGRPPVRRAAGEWTYVFYARPCPPTGICDYDDVVFLRRDRVVTAFLRGGGRRYEGPTPNSVLRP